jgi:hypothetical protein
MRSPVIGLRRLAVLLPLICAAFVIMGVYANSSSITLTDPDTARADEASLAS